MTTDPIKALVDLGPKIQNQVDHTINRTFSLRLELDEATIILAAIEALTPIAAGRSVVVPVEPTRDMWGNDLVRWIVRWMGYERPTPKLLIQDLKMGYGEVPLWLEAEAEMQDQDHVVSKGTRAVLLYRAMIAASPSASTGKDGVVERVARAIWNVDAHPARKNWDEAIQSDDYAEALNDCRAYDIAAIAAIKEGE